VFTMESMLLSLLGCVTGLLIALLVRWGVNAANISYIPPTAPAVPLLVDLDVGRTIFTFILMGLWDAGGVHAAKRAREQGHHRRAGHV